MINHSHDRHSFHSRILIPAVALFVALLPITSMAQPAANDAAAPAQPAAATDATVMPSLWDLAVQGGWFMIPIAVASVVTIAFTCERLFGLRRSRNLPRPLIEKLREMLGESSLDPRKLWEASSQHPSPLANLVKAAVLKTGRPQAEVEKAVEDAVQRETGGMTRNMRPINVVASISPLLGLLGTVQGMILAFMVTSTTTSTGTAKAQELAHGIYTALVTTFAGLTVAVISVVLANYLEGRIERLLQQMESIFLDLLPQLERYEGRIRVSESVMEEDGIKVRQISTGGDKPAAARNPSDNSGSHAAPTKPRAAKPARPKEGPPKSKDKTVATEPAAATSGKTLRSHFDG